MDRKEWDERYAEGERTPPAEPNRLVVAEVEGLAPGRALDLGCGQGRHSLWLASRGWDVVGIDFSLVALARARSRAQEAVPAGRLAFAAADVHALRLEPGRFGLVLAAFFHPQPPERSGAYRAIARALAPGGSFLQVSYDVANLTEGTGGPQNPDLLVRVPQVSRELGSLGLDVVRAETVRLRVPTGDGGEVDVVDAVVRAVKPPSGAT